MNCSQLQVKSVVAIVVVVLFLQVHSDTNSHQHILLLKSQIRSKIPHGIGKYYNTFICSINYQVRKTGLCLLFLGNFV